MVSPILSLDDLVSLCSKSIYFPTREPYAMMLLVAVAVRVQALLGCLEFCVYVLYWGTPESGKTKATRFLCKITRGKFAPKMTQSALLRIMDIVSKNGSMLGIDQYDDQALEHPYLNGCMEIGNDPEAEYFVSENVGSGNKKKIEVTPVRCGGYKVFNAIAPPRHALRTRTYEVHTLKAPKDAAKAISTHLNKQDISAINTTLDAYATAILGNFAEGDVSAYLQSQEHQDGLDCLEGGRKHDLFNVLNTVRHFLGWDIDVAQALSYSNADETLFVTKSVLIAAIQANGWAGKRVTPMELLTAINDQHYIMRIPTLKNAWELDTMMCSIGITERDGFRKKSNRTMDYIFPVTITDILEPSAKQTTLGGP